MSHQPYKLLLVLQCGHVLCPFHNIHSMRPSLIFSCYHYKAITYLAAVLTLFQLINQEMKIKVTFKCRNLLNSTVS